MISSRTFGIAQNEFETFLFRLSRRTLVNVTMIATTPVNVLVLTEDQFVEYEDENTGSYDITKCWNRKVTLDEQVVLRAGAWNIVIEGTAAYSKGRIALASSD